MRFLQTVDNTEQQIKYSKLLLAIGEGQKNIDADMQYWVKSTGEQQFVISNLPFILNEDEVIDFLYSNKIISPDNATQRAFLAISNNDVDDWNAKIQKMNPNQAVSLISKDNICEVDDPHGILNKMLSKEVLNNFNNNQCPPHKLILKIGDICIITRNIAKKEGLANIARVLIPNIQQYCIQVS